MGGDTRSRGGAGAGATRLYGEDGNGKKKRRRGNKLEQLFTTENKPCNQDDATYINMLIGLLIRGNKTSNSTRAEQDMTRPCNSECV